VKARSYGLGECAPTRPFTLCTEVTKFIPTSVVVEEIPVKPPNVPDVGADKTTDMRRRDNGLSNWVLCIESISWTRCDSFIALSSRAISRLYEQENIRVSVEDSKSILVLCKTLETMIAV
jgi:hypothetical protein